MSDTKDSRLFQNIQIAFAVIAVLWAIHIFDMFFPGNLKLYGLRPRNMDHLSGIIFYPLLHGSLRHLMGNSGTLLALLIISLSLSRKMTGFALFIIIFGGGGAVWLFGSPNTVHIGASGVIFGLMGFLLFIGIFQKKWKPLIFSIVVFFAYGGVLISLFTIVPGVSWSGHFWGFISGVAAAWFMRKPENDLKNEKY
ncbi:Rhomboid family protein [Desulfonema limicola]|uniref:Rhomboid family protein n=1 Tax=Desulfonema limicola TaxID=45656 RepID=A0A975GGG3_9BACT|nr:rhomboid family intramembrane serine protease [Desulfonema limicola]QTA80232.1 Rhomboid family protein [Desulfonema limicola]